MLSTICWAKQKSLQMCAELRHCQRWAKLVHCQRWALLSTNQPTVENRKLSWPEHCHLVQYWARLQYDCSTSTLKCGLFSKGLLSAHACTRVHGELHTVPIRHSFQCRAAGPDHPLNIAVCNGWPTHCTCRPASIGGLMSSSTAFILVLCFTLTL